jgi:hypothetical protein
MTNKALAPRIPDEANFMDPQPQFGFKELFTHVISEMAKALCDRPEESRQLQITRTQAATHMILGMRPRDVIEAMLAGHAVMFHALITDSIRDTLQGQIAEMRRGTRTNIVSLNKAFHMNLVRFEQYQARPSQGTREGGEQGQAAGTPDLIRTQPGTAQPQPLRAQSAQPPPFQPPPAQTPPVRTPLEYPAGSPNAFVPSAADIDAFVPSAADIAACRANPEAMAALEAKDFERFARAMGVDAPSEAYLEAAGRQSIKNVPPTTP